MQTINMRRIDKIIHHDLFDNLMSQIRENETGRIFCCHGMGHSLDVARIAYIINLEEQYALAKDIIYAAALLHDIGRAALSDTEKNHHVMSGEYAERILTDAGYDELEREQILEAILMHNTDGLDKPGLPGLLYKADKLSRLCFSCEAYDDCYWTDAEKNSGVLY